MNSNRRAGTLRSFPNIIVLFLIFAQPVPVWGEPANDLLIGTHKSGRDTGSQDPTNLATIARGKYSAKTRLAAFARLTTIAPSVAAHIQEEAIRGYKAGSSLRRAGEVVFGIGGAIGCLAFTGAILSMVIRPIAEFRIFGPPFNYTPEGVTMGAAAGVLAVGLIIGGPMYLAGQKKMNTHALLSSTRPIPIVSPTVGGKSAGLAAAWTF
jgi:hypothetical protein